MVCHLLNKLPDAVALVEPMKTGRFRQNPSREAILDGIEQFAEQQRTSLLNHQIAVSKQVEGLVPDNMFGLNRGPDGLRDSIVTQGDVRFDKPLEADFQLIIKHPALFTALLPDLACRFQCYSLIRNPLSILASWHTTRMNVNNGHAPVAELYDPRLKQMLSTLQNRFDRQIFLLKWYFEQYQQHLAPDRILRYEDIIESQGAVLAAIVPSAESLNEPLENQNQSKVYDWDGISNIAERLLDSEGPYWDFYSRDDTRDLINNLFR